MITSGEHVGKFWLADSPDEVISGHLIVAPEQAPRISVFGELLEQWRRVPPVDGENQLETTFVPVDLAAQPEVTIHGDLFQLNEPMSLMHARAVDWQQRHGGRVADPGTQTFEGRSALIGVHADGPSHLFGGVRVRLRHLDQWAGLGRYSQLTPDRDTSVLTHTFADRPPAALTDGGTVGFDRELSVSARVSDAATVTPHTYLRVQGTTARTWSGFDHRVVTPLISLLTLATGHRAGPILIELDHRGRWVQVIGFRTAHQEASGGPQVLAQQMLAPYGVITLDHVARWLDSVDRLGLLPPVVAHSVASGPSSLETEVLELCTVAEGLHSRLFPDGRSLPHDVAEQARTAAWHAVEFFGEDVATKMKNALTHFGDVTYPTRVDELGKLAERVAPGVTGKSTRWKRAVADSRNHFAHLSDPGFLGEGDIDKHVMVMVSLQWVLRLVLLRETSLDENTLAQRIAHHDPFRLFIEQARQWAPPVYSTAVGAAGT